jgi:tetratricopeptide (TPR) repeat protein
MRVFVSYRRSTGSWVARALRQALEARGVEVFLDVEDIDSGRFESVILNQIELCEHFVVLLDEPTMAGLGAAEDWVGRELDRAMEFQKNVVPVLVDGARIEDVSPRFVRRRELLALNAPHLSHALFEPAVDVIVRRYLTQPSLQEIRRRSAEEHFARGTEAAEQEDWEPAEAEFELAAAAQDRPEYLLHLGVVRYRLGKVNAALTDLDAAIALDPFAFELMRAKYDMLQAVDRTAEALSLVGTWQEQARERASAFARRIVARLDGGDDVVTAVRSVPELQRLYAILPEDEDVGASLACLVEHLTGELQERVHDEFTAWESARSS